MRTADIQDALKMIAPASYFDPVKGYSTMYRVTLARYYMATPTSPPVSVINCTYAPRNNGQRFTSPGGPPSLYLSYEPLTALRETNWQTWPDIAASLTFAVHVRLDSILDLTVQACLDALDMTHSELECDWKTLSARKAFVPTQFLGDAVVKSGRFHAIKYPSMRDPKGSNIAIYCDYIAGSNFVEVYDSTGMLVGRIP